MSGIILNPGTESGLFEHLNVKICPFRNSLCFNQFIFSLEIAYTLIQLFLYMFRSLQNFIHRHNIMRCRKNSDMFQCTAALSGQHIDLGDPVDLISEKLHTIRIFIRFCRKNLQHIAMHAKRSAMKIHIISIIMQVNQLVDHLIPIPLHTGPQRQYHILIIHRAAQPIDTGYTGNDDYIPPLRQCRCCRKTQLVNLIVDGRILRNISVRRRYIRLRLIIIIIGDKVFHCVLREKFLKLTIQLCRQCFIVCYDQCRFI